MTAVLNVLSPSITSLDATPVIPLTAGQGAKGVGLEINDWLPCSTAFLGAVGNYGRLCRVSTKLKVKAFSIFTDVVLDTNATQTLAFDFGVAFSDSAVDGTLAKWQGQIPTTANNGSVTTFASYASPNKLFGTFAMPSHTVPLAPTDITFNGSNTNYPFINLNLQPLWQLFGFVDGQGYPQDPGGFFDIYAYVSTAAATAAAGNLGCRLEYVV